LSIGQIDFWHWLALCQIELLLFAGVFFLLGALDDLAVDIAYLWLRLTGKIKTTPRRRADLNHIPLHGPAAVLVPAWSEAEVIGDTIAHLLHNWPQADLRLYVGCYRNDAATLAAAMMGASGDKRVRLVVHDAKGPTTKADCLARLYRAMAEDEERSARRFAMVVFHDAEDRVDPAALGLLDEAVAGGADFAQLPVEPLVQRGGSWFNNQLGSHYCEEFAESHGKAMVVRGALGAGLPGAGVGCAIARSALSALAAKRSDHQPFACDSLTEDYEMGLAIADAGGYSRFIRARGDDGRLIATRALFPARLDHVVNQKTRWVHGIALQGWDRIGWRGGCLVDGWMLARDRRGPFAAVLLLIGYVLVALTAISGLGLVSGRVESFPLPPLLKVLLWANLAAFVWRAIWRFGFAARLYGWAEGVRAVLRIPLANVVAIMAGRRALVAYAASLRGGALAWDKTPHFKQSLWHPQLGVAPNEAVRVAVK
jgi:bacteriophage N4 adsorption protein B